MTFFYHVHCFFFPGSFTFNPMWLMVFLWYFIGCCTWLKQWDEKSLRGTAKKRYVKKICKK